MQFIAAFKFNCGFPIIYNKNTEDKPSRLVWDSWKPTTLLTRSINHVGMFAAINHYIICFIILDLTSIASHIFVTSPQKRPLMWVEKGRTTACISFSKETNPSHNAICQKYEDAWMVKIKHWNAFQTKSLFLMQTDVFYYKEECTVATRRYSVYQM